MDFHLRQLESTAQPRDASTAPQAQFGYHNTFSTHAPSLPVTPPPTYTQTPSISQRNTQDCTPNGSEELPPYVCNTHYEGFLDVRTELSTPFLISHDNAWHSVFVELHGTQLHLYRTKKSFFKSKAPRQGRLIRTYSLQHAEIGVAVDWRRSELVPKATFARVLPKPAQLKLFETDPELFEPVREYVFRLRVETEQLLFCAPAHSIMLDWVEQICAGIDIAPPLEDRSEPRFRSLPRRTRRQRAIEAAALARVDERSREEQERQFVQEQIELFARLYPNLAASEQTSASSTTTDDRPPTAQDPAAEPDNNEFDREDVLGETAQNPQTTPSSSLDDSETELYDPKTASPRAPMSYNALCRFRRRCAPILLASSARSSNIVFANGGRYQVDPRRCKLVPFTQRPPRYDAHTFSEAEVAKKLAQNGTSGEESKPLEAVLRPSLARGITGASQWSSGSTDVEAEMEIAEGEGEASSVHTTNSASEDLDRIDTVMSTAEPASPEAGKGKGKGKAMLVMGKRSANPLKPLPRSYGGVDNEVSLAAYAPVLV